MKKIIFRIISGALAFLLIFLILVITNSFVGNPVSSAFANKDIKKYVVKNYSSFNLDVDKVSYNFKDGCYVSKAKSKTNEDIHFNIYWRSGKVQRDDYESYVLGGFNTIMRLADEYTIIATTTLQKNSNYKIKSARVMYDKDEMGKPNDKIKLGMKFDKDLPLKAELTVHIDLEDKSLKNIAKILEDVHKQMKSNGYNFSKYGLYSEGKNNYTTVMINEVLPSDIESGNLEEILKKAQNDKEGGGIQIFIK